MKYKYTFFVNNRKESLLRIFYFIYGYTKIFFSRNYFFDLLSFYKILKYSGHHAVVECLDKGSKKLDINFNFYNYDGNFNEIAVVNSGVENLEFCINKKKKGEIKFIAAGPNLVILPTDHKSILSDNLIDIVITPSKWVSNYYIEIEPKLKNKVYEWYSGTDHEYWKDEKKERKFITFYLKYSAGPIPDNINEYILYLKKLGYKIKIIEYNKYNRRKYKNTLNKSKFVIYFVNQESQGLATAEAWSCNTPTLVWNNKQTKIKNNIIKSSCCPYLNQDCGIFFNDINDFKILFNKSINNYNKFAPRDWILKNMTYKYSVQKLIDLISSKL